MAATPVAAGRPPHRVSVISIVQRRGEGSLPITAPMVHATLAAGRALLRGERAASDRHVEPTS